MPTTETRQAPKAAFEFVEPAALTIGDRQDDVTPVTILARSAEPIDHWYWGMFVHDLEGMEYDDRIALDYCHDQYEPLGFGDQFAVTDRGLTVSGQIVHQHEGDMADKVAHKAKAGVPYQASIFFSTQEADLRLEFIPEGAFSEANGREYAGPILIARKSHLRGLAVCLYGYDRHTQSALTDNDSPDQLVTVTIENKDDETMPNGKMTAPKTPKADAAKAKLTDDDSVDTTDDKPTAAASDASNDDAGDTKTSDASNDDDADTKTDDKSDTKTDDDDAELTVSTATLKAYVEEFGTDNGVKWAVEGKALADCRKAHAAALTAELKTSQGETAALKERIASLSDGETDASEFTGDTKDSTPQGKGGAKQRSSELAANRGEGFAALCAANPMPKG